MSFSMRPIGYVEAEQKNVESTPLQSRLNPHEIASVRILPEFVPGLAGLEGFDFAHMITLLHASASGDPPEVDLQPTPLLLRGTERRVGVFATRYPRRPNPIGLSLIRLLSIAGDVIEFAGVDVVDGTPVLDIKPWLPAFDLPATRELRSARIGWYAEVDLNRAGKTGQGRSDDGTERT